MGKSSTFHSSRREEAKIWLGGSSCLHRSAFISFTSRLRQKAAAWLLLHHSVYIFLTASRLAEYLVTLESATPHLKGPSRNGILAFVKCPKSSLKTHPKMMWGFKPGGGTQDHLKSSTTPVYFKFKSS